MVNSQCSFLQKTFSSRMNFVQPVLQTLDFDVKVVCQEYWEEIAALLSDPCDGTIGLIFWCKEWGGKTSASLHSENPFMTRKQKPDIKWGMTSLFIYPEFPASSSK